MSSRLFCTTAPDIGLGAPRGRMILGFDNQRMDYGQ
jgi:hypothetical protein